VATSPIHRLTEEEYLALERAAEIKSEFLNGEIFAMSGGTSRHSGLQRNLLVELANRLEGGPCQPFTDSLKISVPAARLYTYPDLSVVCGQPQYRDNREEGLLNPAVIAEVLSSSTEAYDRGRKFQYYRMIDSLAEYILVDQNQVLVECYSRGADNSSWTLRTYTNQDEEVHINSIGVSIPLSRLYRQIEFTSPTPEQ